MYTIRLRILPGDSKDGIKDPDIYTTDNEGINTIQCVVFPKTLY